ncbi:hypothetical protein WD019_18830 [Fictibacillus sp. Mic-4]|uniref:hypothetical protein n=1 Tax=Fictibacillus TaxID=1329200 RepID=UPI0003FAC3AA|nr:hypothetical protein [Fictibacillus gelatini]
MYISLIIVAALVCVIALVATLYVGKRVDETIQAHENTEGNAAEEELARSRDYETSSFKNVRNLTWIYVITFLVVIIIFGIVMYVS